MITAKIFHRHGSQTVELPVGFQFDGEAVSIRREGEAVILSLDTKVFRGLNAVGSRVWELIDGRRSVDEIVTEIVGEFEVAPEVATRDVGTFVAETFGFEPSFVVEAPFVAHVSGTPLSEGGCVFV